MYIESQEEKVRKRGPSPKRNKRDPPPKRRRERSPKASNPKPEIDRIQQKPIKADRATPRTPIIPNPIWLQRPSRRNLKPPKRPRRSLAPRNASPEASGSASVPEEDTDEIPQGILRSPVQTPPIRRLLKAKTMKGLKKPTIRRRSKRLEKKYASS